MSSSSVIVAECVRSCTTCRAIYRAEFERCPIDGEPLALLDHDPLIGTIVAKHYLVDALLGEGGMGRVYRAHHVLLQHKGFALKVMVGDLAATLEMRMRFAQEADSSSRLAHPNVVSVVDYGKTDEGLLFLVMDLVEGRTLARLIEDEAPLAPARAIELARQVCHGLAHAHDRGLVHRDFKPENVMVRSDSAGERAVIMDFGLAISRDAGDDSPARLTSVGIALGTPTYAAPEQTHGLSVDHRADLFALGVTLYELLAGRVPFDGSGIDVIRQNAAGVVPAIAERSGVAVVPALEAIVRRLMARQPADRYGSAREVIAALDVVEELLTAGTTTPDPVTTPVDVTIAAPKRVRGRRWIPSIVVLAVAGAIVAGVVSVAGPSPLGVTLAPPAAATVGPLVVRDTSHDAPPPPAEPPTPRIAKPLSVARTHTPVEPVSIAPVQTAVVPDVPVVKEVVATVPPPPEPPARIEAPPAPPPRPLSMRARAELRSLEVRGSLSTAVIRRALERIEPQLRGCFAAQAAASRRSIATTVHLTFIVDDTRKASAVQAASSTWPALASCVGEVVHELRTNTAPDVGSVPVSVDIAFTPEEPA